MTEANPRDALCEKYFSQQWAKIKHAVGKSKARNNLRKVAEAAQKCADLRAAGASCGNCSCFSASGPMGIGAHCELDSDYYGYVLTSPDRICSRWSSMT